MRIITSSDLVPESDIWKTIPDIYKRELSNMDDWRIQIIVLQYIYDIFSLRRNV